MKVEIEWSPQVTQRFPQLAICLGVISGIRVEEENDTINTLKKKACEEARAKHDAETLRDDFTVRAYRDMYWKLNIDPTKIRPSGEALLRRVLRGNNLPTISTAVDAYNLASMKTVIPISGFDFDRLTPPFQVRFAKEKETFRGIGMTEPLQLSPRMLVLADEKQIICIYPYRDSDNTKIVADTHTAALVGYGAPETSPAQLREAVEMALSFVKQVAGGRIETVENFSTRK